MQSKSGNIFIYILSALLGCYFIFSAYTKTVPIQFFEYTLQSQLHFGTALAAFAARFFIGLEAALGLLMLVNVFGKGKWVLQWAILLIIAFTVHLVILFFNLGNDVNCGCMGDLVPMSPGLSILKNIVLLVLLFIVLKKSKDDSTTTQHIVSSVLTAIVVLVPFVLFPATNKKLELSKLYATSQNPPPAIDLRKGKHFVGFLSLSCSHCRDAATELSKWKTKNPNLPIYFVIAKPSNDTTRIEMLKDFMLETKAENIPYEFLDAEPFMSMAGTSVPAMFWINDEKIIRQVNIPDLNQKEFELWAQGK